MKQLIIFFFLFIGCASICAAPAYEGIESPFTSVNPSAAQGISGTSQSAYAYPGSSYSSTVYQPFSNTTPAEYSASGMDNTDGNNPSYVSGPRKDKVLGPDTPPADQYPVGEPWVMLAFAVLAAGVIAYKRKKNPSPAKN